MTATFLTTAPSLGLRPLAQSREMSDLIGVYTNRLEDTDIRSRKCISAAAAPSHGHLMALQERRAELVACLTPTPDTARKVLIALLGAFPSYGEDQDTARFILAACCRACAKVPTWAIEEAAARFLEGRQSVDWNMANRPTPPQILAEALRCALPVETELHRIGLVLDAEIVDTETSQAERDMAVAEWNRIKAEIGRSNVLSERSPEEIARERAEQLRANEVVARRERERKASVSARVEEERAA